MNGPSRAALWFEEAGAALDRERAQRAALVERGGALLASSAALVTLLIAVTTLVGALPELDAAPGAAAVPVRVALVLLVVAALGGTTLTLPSRESDIDLVRLDAGADTWFAQELDPLEQVEAYQVRRDAALAQRRANTWRAWLLFAAIAAQLGAVAALVAAAWASLV